MDCIIQTEMWHVPTFWGVVAPSNITKVFNIGIACWKKNIWQRCCPTKFSKFWKWHLMVVKVKTKTIGKNQCRCTGTGITKGTCTCTYYFLFFFAYLFNPSTFWQHSQAYIFYLCLLTPTCNLYLYVKCDVWHVLHTCFCECPFSFSCSYLKPRLPPTVKQSIRIWFPTFFTPLSSPSFQRAFAMNEFFQGT